MYPPSLPTIPVTLTPNSFASLTASIRFLLTLSTSLPPPTDKINKQSFEFNLLTLYQPENTVSHPSSLVLAVNSAILSVGA